MQEVTSLGRLYVLRTLYLLNFVLLGFDVWPDLVRSEGTWTALSGVACSVWAALSLLSGIGIRYPLRMIPLLFFQITYKTIWLLVVAPPLWKAGQSVEMIQMFAMSTALEILVVPWPYVARTYFFQRGDRWR